MRQWEYRFDTRGPEHERCPTAMFEVGHKMGGCHCLEHTQIVVRDGCLVVAHYIEDSKQRVDDLHIDLHSILCLLGMKLRDDPERIVEDGPERWLDEHVGKGMWTVARDLELEDGSWLAWKHLARQHRGKSREEAMARLVVAEMMRSGQ